MTPLAKAMLVLCIVAWCAGVAGWFYGTRYWLPMWAVGFRPRDRHRGYLRKALTGFGVFTLCGAIGFAAGAIANQWGGG